MALRYKYTLIFGYTSGLGSDLVPVAGAKRRVGGWSESYYHPTLLPLDDPSILMPLVTARLAMLPRASVISGIRRSTIDTTARTVFTRVRSVYLQGTYARGVADFASAALMMFNTASTGNRLRLICRGLPDSWCSSGDLVNDPDTGPPIAALKAALTPVNRDSFGQIVRNLGASTADIVDITTGGKVSARQPLVGVAVNQEVRVLRTLPSSGRVKGGKYTVAAVRTNQDFDLLNWNLGDTTGGRIRIDDQTFVGYSGAGWAEPEAIIRKAGRPFGALRGRRTTSV